MLSFRPLALILIALSSFTVGVFAQESSTEESGKPKIIRPERTDKSSHTLIQNFLAVTGGKQAHIELKNVRATGTINEAGTTRQFEIIETQDGKRRILYTWRHLGREHKEVYAFDGVNVWSQVLAPKMAQAKPYGGRSGTFFKSHRWFIQPVIVPLKAAYVFKYNGTDKVNGRPAYVVLGYGKQNERAWFYFDQEKFLITRWGGIGPIANTEGYLDYRASRFVKVAGVLLPKQIDLLAGGAPYGDIEFKEIEANISIDSKLFYAPPNNVPTLRQRPVQR